MYSVVCLADACFRLTILSIVQPIDRTLNSKNWDTSSEETIASLQLFSLGVLLGQHCHLHYRYLYRSLSLLLHSDQGLQGMLCPNYNCPSLHRLQDYYHQSKIIYSTAAVTVFSIRPSNSIYSSASMKGSASSSIPQLTTSNSLSNVVTFISLWFQHRRQNHTSHFST